MSCVYSKVPAESRFGREPVSEEEKSAFNEVVKKLESIPISSSAVGKCQDAIKDKVVDTWNEKVVVMEQKSIQRDNIKDYLKYMQNNYPGMDNELRKKYEGIIFGPWRTYDNDFKQNHGSTETCYGQVNFGKSNDESRFSCCFAFYTAEMKFAKVIVKEEHPFLWGLIYPTFVYEQPPLPMDVLEAIHEYFRYRALHGFLMTGVISKINWVA